MKKVKNIELDNDAEAMKKSMRKYGYEEYKRLRKIVKAQPQYATEGLAIQSCNEEYESIKKEFPNVKNIEDLKLYCVNGVSDAKNDDLLGKMKNIKPKRKKK